MSFMSWQGVASFVKTKWTLLQTILILQYHHYLGKRLLCSDLFASITQ